eukprot:GHUV01048903.1.p1 GENE.GHUV01048903.1~~GHUV01048903.1.p1  ORF type:complete len:108 (+),score=5.64 GHUV01048903.1:275-598(+)
MNHIGAPECNTAVGKLKALLLSYERSILHAGVTERAEAYPRVQNMCNERASHQTSGKPSASMVPSLCIPVARQIATQTGWERRKPFLMFIEPWPALGSTHGFLLVMV